MYVCICNGVTEREIREVAAAGCRNVAELTMRTGCGASCGSCLETAAQLLEAQQLQTQSLQASRKDRAIEAQELLPVLHHAA